MPNPIVSQYLRQLFFHFLFCHLCLKILQKKNVDIQSWSRKFLCTSQWEFHASTILYNNYEYVQAVSIKLHRTLRPLTIFRPVARSYKSWLMSWWFWADGKKGWSPPCPRPYHSAVAEPFPWALPPFSLFPTWLAAKLLLQKPTAWTNETSINPPIYSNPARF